MVTLRGFQDTLVNQAYTGWELGEQNILLQSATASGKTIMAAHVAKKVLNDGHYVVVAGHRDELLDQIVEKFRSNDIKAHKITGKEWNIGEPAPRLDHHQVPVLMIQTQARRISKYNIWARYSSKDLLIFDEAHHSVGDGAWGEVVKQWPGRILGLTATPWRLSRKEGFDHIYDSMYCAPGILSLAEQGHLALPVVVQFNVSQKTGSLYVGAGKDSTGYDYSMSATWRANNNPVLIERALDWLKATTDGLDWWHDRRRVIIYCITQLHAKKVAEACQAKGISAAVLLDKTPADQRKKIVRDFRDGKITHLVNVNLVTEGFDVEDADCVLLLRPTKSLVVYLQAAGRAMRVSDAPIALILDATDSTTELDHPLLKDIQWSLKPRGNDTGPGTVPVKYCNSNIHGVGLCGAAAPLSAHVCSLCGEAFGRECPTCGVWRSWRSISRKDGDCVKCKKGRDAQWDSPTQQIQKSMHRPSVIWQISQNKNLWSKNNENGRRVVIGENKFSEGYYVIRFDDSKDEKRGSFSCVTIEKALEAAEKWLGTDDVDRKNADYWYNVLIAGK